MIKCETCKFFIPTPLSGAGKDSGACKINPPRVLPLPTPQGLMLTTEWPTVQGKEPGCSKGEPKLNDCN